MPIVLRRLLLLVAVALPAAGCESLTLSRNIKREVGATDVSVNLQDTRSVEVSLWFDAPDGDAAGAMEPARDEAARKAAEYIRDHYAGYDRLAEVIVEVRGRRGSAVSSYTQMDGVYTFPRRVLGAPKRAGGSGE